MNKVLQSCMIALAATTLFSACQKDKEHLVDLTAVIVDQPVSNAKVYIDGIYGCWQHGDAVKIKSGSYSTADYALVVSGSEESATRATIPDVAEGTPYTAGYPAANATITGNGTLTIDVPASQSYAEAAIYSGAETAKQRIVCPMAAYSPDGSDLKFYNVAAMLAVTVTNSESSALTLYAVEVESDKSPLSGTASVSVDANGAAITDAASTSQSITLTFSSPVTLTASTGEKTLYIPVLPIDEGQKSTLTVHVKATKSDGTKKYTFHGVSANAISIEANQIGNVPITLDVNDPETAVNDYFWGLGTEECPYLITDTTDLKNLRTVTNDGTDGYCSGKYYKQTADITLSSWGNTPIGNVSSKAFAANYNGDGHSITGISTTVTDASYGLFGYAGGGKIEGVTVSGNITNSNKTSSDGVGGIVGKATSALLIERCTTTVNITNAVSTNTSMVELGFGGICGIAIKAVTINNCVNNGIISLSATSYGKNYCHGGILGKNCNTGTTINYCTNRGAVKLNRNSNLSSNYGKAGGICGHTSTDINVSNCENHATIEGNGTYSGTEFSCYTHLGGIIGDVWASDTISVVVKNCTNYGDVLQESTAKSYLGGCIGSVYGGKRGSTLSDLKAVKINISNFTNKSHVKGKNYVAGVVGYAYGAGTRTSSCKISYPRIYIPDNDEDGSITIYSSGASAGGCIGYFSNIVSTIEKGINEANIKSGYSGTSYNGCGGMVGMNTVYEVTVTDCKNSGNIETTSASGDNQGTGGIVGYGYTNTSISRCQNTGNISGKNHVAGIIGRLYSNGTLDRCLNEGKITGTAASGNNLIYVAGIVGMGGVSSMTNCGNTGAISTEDATDSYYGIAGLLACTSAPTTVKNCFCNTNITTASSDANTRAAGLVSQKGCNICSTSSPMMNCYYYGTLKAYNARTISTQYLSETKTTYQKNCYGHKNYTVSVESASTNPGVNAANTFNDDLSYNSGAASTPSYWSSEKTLLTALNDWVDANNPEEGDPIYLKWETKNSKTVLKFVWDFE